MERHARQCGTFITKNINTNNWRQTVEQGKHYITGSGSIKYTQPVYTKHFSALIILMLLCSFTDWKWRMPHQSSPFIPIHYGIRRTSLLLNCTTDEHSCLCKVQLNINLQSGCWSPSGGYDEHYICSLDVVYNTTLAGQRHCVIPSFYSCDPGVSLQPCVVCPTWSFLSHCICCYPRSL